MKTIGKVSRKTFGPVILVCLSVLVASCDSHGASASSALTDIDAVRSILALPESSLEFVKDGNMVNSPGGDLQVAIYQDAQGRSYSVAAQTGQVVEIDARATLPARSGETHTEVSDELEQKALAYAQALLPDFDALQPALTYEAGAKGDYSFFTWYGELQPGALNRPFLQFAFGQDGTLFAYYNTLELGD